MQSNNAPLAPGQQNRLLLIDGLNIVRRVYEAVPGEDSEEKATGALKSSWASILRAIRETSPTHFLAAFDYGGTTWRHKLYPQYKEHRSPMPTVLKDALPGFLDRMNDAGLKTLRVPDVEADDTLGTISVKAVARGFDVVLVSTDKDMLRLIEFGVRIRDHFKSEYRDEAYVLEKYGVASRLMGDMLGLMGDVSDGIPGVAKIGIKTAAKLLNEYGGLDNILDAACSVIDPIKGAIGVRLQESVAIARLSRDLAALKLNVPLGISPNDIRLPPSVAELIEVGQSSKGRTGKIFSSPVTDVPVASQMVPTDVIAAVQSPKRMRA